MRCLPVPDSQGCFVLCPAGVPGPVLPMCFGNPNSHNAPRSRCWAKSGLADPTPAASVHCDNRTGVPLVGNEDKAQSNLAQTVRGKSKPDPGTQSSREICWPSPSMLNLSRADPTLLQETERIRPADPSVPPVPGTEARWRSGLADRTAPEQVSQVPGLRELRLAECQQILPLTGNRKPASDRAHWLQPVPCARDGVGSAGTEHPLNHDPKDFEWLYSYSPYQHVKQGIVYPAILSMTADSDSRVDPHARQHDDRTPPGAGGQRPRAPNPVAR